VTVSSTWSTDSTFGRLPTLCRTILDAVSPRRYTVAAVLHPNVWTVHGRRQVAAWLSDCLRDGMLLIPPERGWQATMIASDWVIGDHGSTTAYAAALGRPVTLATHPGANLRDGSIADLVRKHAPALRDDQSLPQQAKAAVTAAERLSRVVAEAITSRQGQAAAILREAMYRLLQLSEPLHAAEPAVFPAPEPIRTSTR
jgi:hypothetical protein